MKTCIKLSCILTNRSSVWLQATPQSRWDLHSSRILHSIYRLFLTYISEPGNAVYSPRRAQISKDMIWYIFSCNWVDTRWQQYSSHLHTSSTPNTKNGTYITITKLNMHNNKILTNLWSAGRAPSLRVIPWHLPYNWGKSTEKSQLCTLHCAVTTD